MWSAVLLLALVTRSIFLSGHPLESQDGIAYIKFTQAWFEQRDAALPPFAQMPPPLLFYLGRILMFTGMSAATALLVINFTAGVLLVIPTYLIGRYIYNERNAGLWFAAFTAVMPPLVTYSCCRLRESLFLFFLFWIVALWLMAYREVKPRWSATGAGACAVLALYCRYEALELLPFVLAGLPLSVLYPGWNWKRAGQMLVLAACGVIAAGLILKFLPGMPDIISVFCNRLAGRI